MRPSTSPLRELMSKRDFYAGGLMLLLGLGIALKGATYRPGTLMHMGPGFFPTALGVLLVILGIAIAADGIGTIRPRAREHGESILPEHPQWWGWFCILMSPVLFIFFGRYFGMAPGTFACVSIAALRRQAGDLEEHDHPGNRRDDIRRRPVLLFPAGANADFHLVG